MTEWFHAISDNTSEEVISTYHSWDQFVTNCDSHTLVLNSFILRPLMSRCVHIIQYTRGTAWVDVCQTLGKCRGNIVNKLKIYSSVILLNLCTFCKKYISGNRQLIWTRLADVLYFVFNDTFEYMYVVMLQNKTSQLLIWRNMDHTWYIWIVV